MKTKKRKPQQLLEVSSVGWKTVLLWEEEEELQSVVFEDKGKKLESKVKGKQVKRLID